MAAPQWFDGKDSTAGKLFGDDFEAGNVKLTFKTAAANGLAIKVEGSQGSSGAVDGLLETKYTFQNGMAFLLLLFLLLSRRHACRELHALFSDLTRLNVAG